MNVSMNGETSETAADWAPPGKPERRPGRVVFWLLVILAVAATVAGLGFSRASVHTYSDSATSMEPTIMPGHQLYVAEGRDVRRGDVIVFSRAGTSGVLVKRIIGLPGDRVACCNTQGWVTLNGKPLDETYISRSGPPSARRFSVTLGRNQIWVMGDDRAVSLDSREWGPLPVSDITGRVVATGNSVPTTILRTPRTFVTDGLAPTDHRLTAYVRWLAVGGIGLVALVILIIVGVIRFFLRLSRRRRPGRPAGGDAG